MLNLSTNYSCSKKYIQPKSHLSFGNKFDIDKDELKSNLNFACFCGAVGTLLSTAIIKLRVEQIKNITSTIVKMPEQFKSLIAAEEPFVEKIVQEGFDPDLAKIFAEVKNIEDKKDFAKAAFHKILDYMGYDRYHPSITFAKQGTNGKSSVASWHSLSYEVALYENHLTKNKKFDILNSLKHELEHFDQDVTILRTEGFGPEKLLELNLQSIHTNTVNDLEHCLEAYNKHPSEITIGDVKNYLDGLDKDLDRYKIISKYYIQKKGLIKAGTPEFRKATQLYEGLKNYTNPKEGSPDYQEQLAAYNNNILERFAYSAGDQFQRSYQAFILRILAKKGLTIN